MTTKIARKANRAKRQAMLRETPEDALAAMLFAIERGLRRAPFDDVPQFEQLRPPPRRARPEVR